MIQSSCSLVSNHQVVDASGVIDYCKCSLVAFLDACQADHALLNDVFTDSAEVAADAAGVALVESPAVFPPFSEFDDYGRRVHPGDILSFRRRMYSHDTIYVGDGYVVHLWNTERRVDFEGNSAWFTSLSGQGTCILERA